MAPKQRQTLLFSATFNDDVAGLVALSLKQPVRLAADAAATAPSTLSQEVSAGAGHLLSLIDVKSAVLQLQKPHMIWRLVCVVGLGGAAVVTVA